MKDGKVTLTHQFYRLKSELLAVNVIEVISPAYMDRTDVLRVRRE